MSRSRENLSVGRKRARHGNGVGVQGHGEDPSVRGHKETGKRKVRQDQLFTSKALKSGPF